jgi:hypothetical protein
MSNLHAPRFWLLAAIASTTTSTALAAPGGNGVPGGLGEMQAQLETLQQSVDELSAFVEAETASTGEAYAEICFDASLGLQADGTIAVQGVNEVGRAAGIDLHGFIDAKSGINGQGRAQLAAMLESGVEMTVRMCLNAGVTEALDVPNVGEPLPAPEGLESLLVGTRGALETLYGDFPALVSNLPVGPESVNPAIDELANAAWGTDDFSPTALLSQDGWADAVDGLPGAAVLEARYAGVQEAFAEMAQSDVCTYYEAVGPILDPDLADYVSQTCVAVPAGIDNSMEAASDTLAYQYTALTQTLPTIENWTTATYMFLHDTEYPVLATVKSLAESTKHIVDDICSTIGC